MSKVIALMMAFVLGGHGLLGLFIEGQPLLLFNVDLTVDALHLLCAGVLAFAGRPHASVTTVRGGLLLVAVLQAGVGLMGLGDRHLGGLAPTGLQPLDFLLTFGFAGAALLAAVLPRAGENIWESAEGQSGSPLLS